MPRIIAIALISIFLLPLSALSADSDSRLAKLAREKGMPVVAQFGDGQCPPCILQETYIKKVKKKRGKGVVFEFAHVRDERAMTMAYKVWMTPTLLFIDADGVEVARYGGLMKVKALDKKLVELGWVE